MGGGRAVRRWFFHMNSEQKISFRMLERYEMHANKLNKWLMIVFLPTESRVTCVVEARGG